MAILGKNMNKASKRKSGTPATSPSSTSRPRRRAQTGRRPKAIERQHEKGRLTARERVEKLIDRGASFRSTASGARTGCTRSTGPAAGGGDGSGLVQGGGA